MPEPRVSIALPSFNEGWALAGPVERGDLLARHAEVTELARQPWLWLAYRELWGRVP